MQDDLPKTAANHVALSPVSFLPRAAHVWGKRIAIIHGARRITYAQFLERSRRLASALRQAGIAPGDVVAALLPNIPEMVEVHFAVPMAGAVLNALNTRLDYATLLFMLRHGEAKLLIIDSEYSPLAEKLKTDLPELIIIGVHDHQADTQYGQP
jgi:fatty-acyl-CoA synthase